MYTSVLKIAKAFAEAGRAWLDEHQLTKMIEQHALLDRRAGETPEQAFSRVFCADTVEGGLFRKVVAVAKTVGLTPLEIAPIKVGGDDVDVNDPAKALAQLQRLADEQRRRSPDLTEAQAFSRVFSDPANAALAAKAHRRPAATTSFPFPH
jgi:hypothetical protein